MTASQADWDEVERYIEPTFIVQHIKLNQLFKCTECDSLYASVEPYVDRIIPTTTDGQLKLEREIKYIIEADPATGRLLYLSEDK